MIDELEQDGSLVALFPNERYMAWHTAVPDCSGSKDTPGHCSKSEMLYFICVKPRR